MFAESYTTVQAFLCMTFMDTRERIMDTLPPFHSPHPDFDASLCHAGLLFGIMRPRFRLKRNSGSFSYDVKPVRSGTTVFQQSYIFIMLYFYYIF